MRKWDEALLQFRASPYFYKRFIDDGFGIWPEGEKELKLFAEYANSIGIGKWRKSEFWPVGD